MDLSTLDTPALILEEGRFTRNVERVHTAIRRHPGVTLRPHFKTVKSIEALERIFLANRAQATVSTDQRSGALVPVMACATCFTLSASRPRSSTA